MADRWSQYRAAIDGAARGDGLSPEDLLTFLARDLNDRLTDQEGRVLSLEAIKATILETVLAYNQVKLTDAFDRLRVLTDVGLLFEATSTTVAEVAIGTLTLVVAEADRARFTPAGFVGVMKTGDPSIFMAGQRVAYDRAAGLMTIEVDRLTGSGTHADWTIIAVSGTDYAAAAQEAAGSAAAAEVTRAEAEAARDEAQGHADNASIARAGAEAARSDAEAAATGAASSEAIADAHLAALLDLAQHVLPPGSANPTTKPNGAPVEEGDFYWNTSAKELRRFDGLAWGVAYVPATSAVSSFNGRTGGVAPADGDYAGSQVVVSPSILGQTRVQAVLAAMAAAVAAKLDTAVLSGFMLGLLDDADAAAARTTLGAAATSHEHAWTTLTSGVPGTIAALAGGTAAADRVWYYTGPASGAFMTVSAFARTILDDADGAAILTTIGAAAAGHGHAHAVPGGASGFLSGTDKTKLDGIEVGANAYTHPTGDGARHVPANGTTNAGKVLKASGTAGAYSWDWVIWSELTGVPAALSAIGTLTAAADRLAYYDGASTAALTPLTAFGRSLIDDVDAATARTTLGAAASSHAHADATAATAGFLSTADKTKLDGIAANANAYLHPSGDGNRHVPATGTTNSGKVLKAGATAASEAWGDVAWTEVTSKPTIIQAIAGLTPAADRLAYLTGIGAGSAALTPFTAFARSLLDDGDAATARTTLGISSALDVQLFTTSGTWTKPSGKSDDTPVLARGWGGGGSGARSSGTAQDRSGGGGGAFNWVWLRLGDLPATVPVTIAAGGGPRTSNQAGQAGGDSTFGTFLTCHGGAGGTQTGSNSPGGGGGGVRGAASGATGGLGTGASGDTLFGGATGASGHGAASHFGGGAGAGAENDRNGGNSEWGGAGGSARSGLGGVSKFGGNGGSSTAKDGIAPGGGGAGDSTTSGAGARGEIHVIVF
ncbi:hypothetical protein ABB55_14105 [Prosthecomicrobium hirschii]|uniref:Glycine-rich domain-containing protein n=1 Tax=Prosthecodimorpha hirschii TaxID=665126 RepID=A0A0P6W451_9HYPH|nr:hypothetical protein [Prosthecomicrobium hirschii]KPL53206.1 hypothetical protein ABB55_14105 [Prosthecomicrobium hirschii]